MKLRELDPAMLNRVVFNRRELTDAPESSGCYVLATIDDEILYIGRTVNLRTRLGQHLNDPDKQQADGVATSWFYYRELPETQLSGVESGLLARHYYAESRRPPMNAIGP